MPYICPTQPNPTSDFGRELQQSGQVEWCLTQAEQDKIHASSKTTGTSTTEVATVKQLTPAQSAVYASGLALDVWISVSFWATLLAAVIVPLVLYRERRAMKSREDVPVAPGTVV